MEDIAETGRDLQPDPTEPPRPKTWGECLSVKRGTKDHPCPYAGCKYHLALYVTEAGSLVTTFEGLEADEIPYTCSLAFVEENPDGATLEQIGKITGCTRERIRQIESRALARLNGVKFDEEF